MHRAANIMRKRKKKIVRQNFDGSPNQLLEEEEDLVEATSNLYF
jgi:hypothetical protein